jgi:hypothetical protein
VATDFVDVIDVLKLDKQDQSETVKVGFAKFI